MNQQNEINALKAQVNYLREILINTDKRNYDEPTFIIQDVLSTTPEQCLAEIKAKAIEDAIKANTHYARDCDGDSYSWIAPRGVKEYVKKLREQTNE